MSLRDSLEVSAAAESYCHRKSIRKNSASGKTPPRTIPCARGEYSLLYPFMGYSLLHPECQNSFRL